MESAQYPMRGRGQVPPAALDRLFRAVDDNESGTVTFDEFVGFVRRCNPVDEDQPEGWAAFVGAAAAAEEEKMVLHVGRTGAADRWRKVRHAAVVPGKKSCHRRIAWSHAARNRVAARASWSPRTLAKVAELW